MRLALAALVAALALAAPAGAATAPLGHAGRWITDAQGRAVIMHGVNEVQKFPPYYPAITGFGDDDAAFLQANGFNAVRLGVIWKALEPAPGVYDDAYLGHIADTVQTLARHGIYSLLDFHQDLLNEKFGGEGFPDWAVVDDGLPAQPLTGFPLSYGTSPGLNAAMESFYSDAKGVQDRFAAAWRHVAERFASDPAVLGYDLFNEPWSLQVNFPLCITPGGCPTVEQRMLAPAEANVMRSIRRADAQHLLFYEPIVETQYGLSKYTIPNPTGDPRAGMSFHIYCLAADIPLPGLDCPTEEQASMDQAQARAAANGDTSLLTEYGATTDTALTSRMVARSDRAMVGWMWWAYTGNDPTTSGGGGAQAIVNDPAKPPTGSNVKEPTLKALVEPYPEVVAGTPHDWHFDRAAAAFSLTYSTGRPGGNRSFPTGAVSEIAAPALVYPGGYAARVTGGAIVSPPRAGVLQIAQCPGAGAVTVTLAPAGARSSATCRATIRISAVRRGGAIRVRVLAVLGTFRRALRGATVIAGRARGRTDSHGRATLRTTARSVRASAPGFVARRARVR